MSVVAVEYPGYGLSGEEFSTDLFFKTAEAAVEYFRDGVLCQHAPHPLRAVARLSSVHIHRREDARRVWRGAGVSRLLFQSLLLSL